MTTLLTLLLATSSYAAAPEPEPTVQELLDATDDVARGKSSEATISMEVKTSRFERKMKMRSLSMGTEHSLVTILEPEKDAGVSTLKVEENLWNYLPKVDRTMKIPSGMMGGSWMGSHFSNDDLVKGSRMSEDYTASITSKPSEEAEEADYVIELVPNPNAPVVWGKVRVSLTFDKVPKSILYYDEKGELVRTMTYADVEEIDERKVPMTMTLIPADKPDEYTKMHFDTLKFDVPVSEKTFTLQALKR